MNMSLDGDEKSDSQYFGRVVDGATSEEGRVVVGRGEVSETHVMESVGEEHEEHEGVVGGHGAVGIGETGPDACRVEGMVWNEPFVGEHGDPNLLFLAHADVHHATVVVEGETSGFAVGPEAVCGGEVEVTAPSVVDAVVGEDCVETATVADIQDEVEEVWTDGRDDGGIGGVDEEVVVDLEAMASGEMAKGALEVVSLGEVTEMLEGGGRDGSVIEEGDVLVSGEVGAVVVDGSLDVALVWGVDGGETDWDVGRVVRDVVVPIVWKGVVDPKIVDVDVDIRAGEIEVTGRHWHDAVSMLGADGVRRECEEKGGMKR